MLTCLQHRLLACVVNTGWCLDEAFAQASLRHEPFFVACEDYLPVKGLERGERERVDV